MRMTRNYLYNRWDLERMKAEKNIEALINMLNYQKSSIRECAARFLGDLSDVRAVEPLTRVLKEEENISVHESIKEALDKIAKKSGDIIALKN